MNPTESGEKEIQVSNVQKDNATFNQERSHTDVSDRVSAQVDDEGYITFYLDQQKVGRVRLNDENQQYEFAEEFAAADSLKAKSEPEAERLEQPQSYVDGCDMGWC
ncbi:DUF2553 family protein [Bacillus sp. H-16]|uniref:DUF2553 family protein n=1 Tax=Alteribacter salitolerans TaxID=2912333 RepID=UPI0019634D09|nr:DUF2553 family protein [Alteribacter salitolerans]MBM7096978.1 DUF2553 family protein [Alteribacter salitolerans]